MGTRVTFIDRYIEQGQQQGLVIGEKIGEERGELKGLHKMLLRQMALKFGELTPAQRRRIAQADGETLLRWSEQVLFAATAEEALR